MIHDLPSVEGFGGEEKPRGNLEFRRVAQSSYGHSNSAGSLSCFFHSRRFIVSHWEFTGEDEKLTGGVIILWTVDTECFFLEGELSSPRARVDRGVLTPARFLDLRNPPPPPPPRVEKLAFFLLLLSSPRVGLWSRPAFHRTKGSERVSKE